MKVLAIVASARKTGNSEILAKEMLAALPESVEKRLVRLAELNIEPCRACYACLPHGCNCVIGDDFAALLAAIRDADAVIIASPVYFLGMNTHLKLVCDRLIAVLNEADSYTGRRCVVAVPYGVEGWRGFGVEATVSFARFLHLEVVGVLPVHAANPGEAARPEILAAARSLAGNLLAVGLTDCAAQVIQAQQRDELVCPFCGSGLLRLTSGGGVRCGLCDARGRLTDAEKGLSRCHWEAPEHLRFSPQGMKEHGERLENIKQEFLARRSELSLARTPYRKLEW